MGVKSFQNFLKRCQHDLPNSNDSDPTRLNGENDNEIANLYEKMAKYTSR